VILLKCSVHSNIEAIGTCTKCGRMVCHECSSQIDGKLVCRQCAGTTTNQTQVKGADESFCQSCGAIIKKEAEICPKCGVRQKNAPGITYGPSGKSRILAALLAIFLGTFGIHKFYLGKNGQGIIYLIFCWTTIPTWIGIIEGIIYLITSDADFERKYAH
jgi:TM2 domain-containing membrane protein YozV